MQNNTSTEETSPEEVEQTQKGDEIIQSTIETETETGSDPDSDSDSDSGRSSRYNEGDPLTFVRVRFPGNAKSQPFLVGTRFFQYGQKVLAMSDRGMTVGYINSFPYDMTFKKDMLPLKSISKVASEEDIEEQRSFTSQEKKAENVCKKLIDDFKLEMNITHVEFIQFGKKAVFYFNAPARVDFRNLVKSLVGELKMRIELRQISVRDRTAALGAIGSCGLQTCCSSFLKNYGNVSIKMAKNQNLALIPSKLNGVCGQIKCCIKYEDNVYSEKRKRLPREHAFIVVANGDRGKVTRLHILIEQFEMLTDKGVFKKYALNQFDPELKLPDDWKFPERFDHITNETSEIIGLVKDDLVKGELYYENAEDFDAEVYLDSLSGGKEEMSEETKDPKTKAVQEKVEVKAKADPYEDEAEDDEPNFNKEEFNKSVEIDARDNKRLGNRGPRNNSNKKNPNSKKKHTKKPFNKNRPNPNQNKEGGGAPVEGEEKRPNNKNRNRNRNRNRNKNRNKPAKVKTGGDNSGGSSES